MRPSIKSDFRSIFFNSNKLGLMQFHKDSSIGTQQLTSGGSFEIQTLFSMDKLARVWCF
jgi:hypothetical protein